MEATQRYELIRPILQAEKTVFEIHQETKVPLSTLYRYLVRFREGNQQLESLSDWSHAAHAHPNWLTEEEKDQVILYRVQHPLKSHRQIAQDLADKGMVQLHPKSVALILAQRRLPAFFFRQPIR